MGSRVKGREYTKPSTILDEEKNGYVARDQLLYAL